MGTHTRSSLHTRTSDVTTVTGRESPSLPRHRGCLFHLGGLVARQRLELRRVLGGRGDLAGPRRRRAAEHREDQTTSATLAGPRSHLPSGPRPPSRPSLLEVLADPEDRNGQKLRSALSSAHGPTGSPCHPMVGVHTPRPGASSAALHVRMPRDSRPQN